MFVACGIWCLADVSSVSPSSEQTALLLNSQSDLHPKLGCRTCGLTRFVSGLRFIFSLSSSLYFFRAPPRRPDRRLLHLHLLFAKKKRKLNKLGKNELKITCVKIFTEWTTLLDKDYRIVSFGISSTTEDYKNWQSTAKN